MSLGRLLWSFKGRIGRGGYWGGILILNLWFFLMLVAAGALLGPPGHRPNGPEKDALEALLAAVIFIPFVVGSWAISIKRFHDRGKSGWWVLIVLIPLIGPLWILVELGCLAGDAGANSYGPAPQASAGT